ncbi:MAG TPA: DUF4124 domain-containing protein [Steroidobacteraceae bacterium]|nr:DUF4124 domain-containing protein [Steroidobacteraceae bacterium]
MKRVLVCAALLIWSGVASAVVYKWVDAKGDVQYGDRPPDGVKAEVVELLGTHPGQQQHASSKSEAPSPKAPPLDPSVKDPTKAVADDVAATKQKQCADAQERYRKLIEGRRLYKTGENGERQYLSSEEIDSERLNAKRDIEEICNSPT